MYLLLKDKYPLGKMIVYTQGRDIWSVHAFYTESLFRIKLNSKVPLQNSW